MLSRPNSPTRLDSHTSKGSSGGRFLGGLTLAVAVMAAVGAVGCDSEESSECSKDTECQEITCGDGTKLQSCSDGVCLQGRDCKDAGDGGW